MAQYTQMIAFLFLVLGCSLVQVNSEECTKEVVEACSQFVMSTSNDTDPAACEKMRKSLECYENLQCEVPESFKETQKKAVDSLKASLANCPSTDNTDAPSGSSTCEDDVVMKCQAMVQSATAAASNVNVSECMVYTMAAGCLKGALVNCDNKSVETTLKEKQAMVTKEMADKKCCDINVVRSCMENGDQYMVTNETATAEKCKKLFSAKSCVDKEFNSCDDEKAKKSVGQAIEMMVGGVEICKSEGFTAAGVAIKPALTILFAVCLVTLSKLI